MAFDKKSLDSYVEVSERIEKFYIKYPHGSLRSEVVKYETWQGEYLDFMTKDAEGRKQLVKGLCGIVIMKAQAFREPGDPNPGEGHSTMMIPGTTPYTRDSEVENAETSAWGRALAALGFEVRRGIASRQEIQNKRTDDFVESSADKNSTAGVARDGKAGNPPSADPSAPTLPLRARPCPKCGVVGHLMKGKEEYGGGWLCYKKNGGCNAKFKEEPGLVVKPPPATEAAFTSDHRDALKAAATKRLGATEGPKWLTKKLVELKLPRWSDMKLDQFAELMRELAELERESPPVDESDLDVAFGDAEQAAIQKEMEERERGNAA